jgi:hypothetical protein
MGDDMMTSTTNVARLTAVLLIAVLLAAEPQPPVIAQELDESKIPQSAIDESDTVGDADLDDPIVGDAGVDAIELNGRVLDHNGNPVAQGTVRVVAQAAGTKKPWETEVTTGDDGTFRLRVRADPRRIPGLRISATNADATQLGFYRFPSTVTEPAGAPIDIELSPIRVVRVRVVDDADQPIAAAHAAVQLGYPINLHSTTDGDGVAVFAIPDKEPINWVVAWKDEQGLDYRIYQLSRQQQADLLTKAPSFPDAGEEKLVLDGAAPVTLRILDDEQQPIAGVRIYPWLLKKESEDEQLNLSFLTETIAQPTDADGKATFAWIPKWQQSVITFWPDSADFVHQRANYDPTRGTDQLDVVLERLVPIRGHVRHGDGRPAAGIEVIASGASYAVDSGRASSKTNETGAYELLVPPNQIFLVIVKDQQWAASPQTGFAVLKNQAIEAKDFTLRPATRVHGILVNEETFQPLAAERVHVYQYGQDLHSMDGVVLPNPEDSRRYVRPVQVHSTKTDELGHFELFLGDGSFDIRPPQQEKAEKFEIAGEAELGFRLTTKIDREFEMVGVVRDEATNRTVAGVRIEGVARNFRGRDWRATTDDEGKFMVKRRAEPTYLHAVSEDKGLAAIIEIEPQQTEVDIVLSPVGSARGRLLTTESKEPWGGQVINYAFNVPGDEGQIWSPRFGGKVITAADGTFQVDGLVPGREYGLTLPSGSDGSIPGVAHVTVAAGQMVDLGDVHVPPPPAPFVPPTLEQRIAQAFDVAGTPVERHQKAGELAKLVNQHLLIVFGEPEDPRVKRLMDIRFNDREYRLLSDEYRMLAIGTDKERRAAADELAGLLEESLDDGRGDFLIVIVDEDGNKVATADADALVVDEELAKDRLLNLLRSQVPQPPDAHELLAAALDRAQQENKRVLIQETATWCGPCHLLSRFLEDHRVWEKDYVSVKMDHRWTGARELMAELRGDADGGIPWFAILDASGAILATSNDLHTTRNIGYPSETSGQAHFKSMLQGTRQRLTDEEIDQMVARLAAAEN